MDDQEHTPGEAPAEEHTPGEAPATEAEVSEPIAVADGDEPVFVEPQVAGTPLPPPVPARRRVGRSVVAAVVAGVVGVGVGAGAMALLDHRDGRGDDHVRVEDHSGDRVGRMGDQDQSGHRGGR